MIRVSRKLVMFKAKSIYDEKCGNSKAMKNASMASNGWLVKFMSCNNRLLQRKTLAAQNDLSHFTGKLVGYLMHVPRLAMKGNYPLNTQNREAIQNHQNT